MNGESGAASKAAAAEARVKILEGVDFIETEEDAEAVESAVVKIQSTFRGKKIRSKLGGQSKAAGNSDQQRQASSSAKSESEQASTKAAQSAASEGQSAAPAGKAVKVASSGSKEEELNEKVAGMQVNDNREAAAQKPQADREQVPPEEADRAAAKIQAGFKGYKTRKELEGKLGSSLQAAAAGSSPEQAGTGAKEGGGQK